MRLPPPQHRFWGVALGGVDNPKVKMQKLKIKIKNCLLCVVILLAGCLPVFIVSAEIVVNETNSVSLETNVSVMANSGGNDAGGGGIGQGEAFVRIDSETVVNGEVVESYSVNKSADPEDAEAKASYKFGTTTNGADVSVGVEVKARYRDTASSSNSDELATDGSATTTSKDPDGKSNSFLTKVLETVSVLINYVFSILELI